MKGSNDCLAIFDYGSSLGSAKQEKWMGKSEYKTEIRKDTLADSSKTIMMCARKVVKRFNFCRTRTLYSILRRGICNFQSEIMMSSTLHGRRRDATSVIRKHARKPDRRFSLTADTYACTPTDPFQEKGTAVSKKWMIGITTTIILRDAEFIVSKQ